MIKIGTIEANDIIIGGTNPVQKVYWGTTLVWQRSSSRLPEGYTELKYIESNSSYQYIDTGLKLWQTTTTSYTIDIKVNVSGGKNNYAGVICFNSNPNSSGWYGYCIQRYSKNPSKICKITNGNVITEYGTLNETLEIHDTMTDLNITNPHNLTTLLFATCGDNKSYIYMKLYSCKITVNNEIVRNFIPCLNPEGRSGLYDTVNGVFYGSANNVDFLYTTPPLPIVLPSGYTQLEYIESTATGGQYIETNLNMWSVMPVEYEVDMGVNILGLGKDNHKQAVLLSNNYEVQPYPGFIIRKSANNNRIEQNKLPNVTSYGNLGQYLEIHQAQSNINDTAHTVTVSLFCGKDASGTPFRYSHTRLYYCRLRANSPTWQRDFVPCLNDEGVAGLFDLVEKKFYSSPNGVAFVAGNEI